MRTKENNKNLKPFTVESLNETVERLSESLDQVVNGDERTAETIQTILSSQKEDGSFGLLDPDNVGTDARIDFYYKPTYLAAAILMKALMIDEASVDRLALRKALDVCCGRKLTGHGYDALMGQLEALTIFSKAGLREFLCCYGDLNRRFTKMIRNVSEELSEREARIPSQAQRAYHEVAHAAA